MNTRESSAALGAHLEGLIQEHIATNQKAAMETLQRAFSSTLAAPPHRKRRLRHFDSQSFDDAIERTRGASQSPSGTSHSAPSTTSRLPRPRASNAGTQEITIDPDLVRKDPE